MIPHYSFHSFPSNMSVPCGSHQQITVCCSTSKSLLFSLAGGRTTVICRSLRNKYTLQAFDRDTAVCWEWIKSNSLAHDCNGSAPRLHLPLQKKPRSVPGSPLIIPYIPISPLFLCSFPSNAHYFRCRSQQPKKSVQHRRVLLLQPSLSAYDSIWPSLRKQYILQAFDRDSIWRFVG